MTAVSLARRMHEPLTAAVAAALLAAMLHSLVAWLSRDAFSHFTWSWTGRDAPWMLALGYLTVMMPLGVAFSIIATFRRAGVSLRVTTAAFATLVALSVLLLFDRVASIAWLVVAIAIGARLGEWVAVREAPYRRLVRRFALVSGMGYLVLGIWLTAGRAAREARAIAALPLATGVSNVLLIILDTVTASDLGLYGNPRPTTPIIDSVAAGAVVFDQAFSPAPWTLPSHASMFTGLWPSQHGADWETPLGDGPPTLAEHFLQNGYATGAFTANLIATGSASGLPRGFIAYYDVKRSLGEIGLHSTIAQGISVRRALRIFRDTRWLGGSLRALLHFDLRPDNQYQVHVSKSAAEVSDEFIDWQRSTGGRPFFAFLNYFDAHASYQSPLRQLFDGGRTPRDRHEGALRYIDGEIDRVLAQLRASGDLDRTIVVITADHGELFGEHGLSGHGNSLYRQLLHVPLLIRFPDGRGAGMRIPSIVSTRDLAQTLASSANLAMKHSLGGESLLPLIEGREQGGRLALAELSQGVGTQDPASPNANGPLTSVTDDTLHVIREHATGRIQAFRYRGGTSADRDVVEASGGRAHFLRYLTEALRRVQDH